jgi:4-amino-4-deoxy-L-arabinose transferase-like glycosyltransferase
MTAPPERHHYRRDLLWIVGAALVLRAIAALLVPWTPYLDSSYYTLVAERLATGHGFTVPIVWSFLEVGSRIPGDASLPIPSNAHWPPLGPMLSAAGMTLLGPSWQAGQVPHLIVSAAIPPITYMVSRDMFGARGIAIGAAVLAIFAGPLFILYPLIDNFALFGLLGTAVLWTSAHAARASRPGPWLVAGGIAAGLATLTRVDGVFLTLAPAAAWLLGRGATPWRISGARPSWLAGLASAGAFLVVMAPWLIRQTLVYGSPLPSTGGHTLWIRSYNEMYSTGDVSLATYLAWGADEIIGSKLTTLGMLVGQTMVLMGGLLVVSFAWSLWAFRRRADLAPFFVYFGVLLLVMAGIFTFHAPEGVWYHSAPAWLGFGYPLALAGIGPMAEAAGRLWPLLRRRRAHAVLGGAGVTLAVVLSIYGALNLHDNWLRGRERNYDVAQFFIANDRTDDVVMYHHAAILNLESGNPAVGFPFDPYPVIERAVRVFDVEWVVVAGPSPPAGVPPGLWDGGEAVDALGNRADFLATEPSFETDSVRIYEVVQERD